MPTITALGAATYRDTEPLFRLPIVWNVAAATENGYIVQHIQRNEKFKRVGQQQRGRHIVTVTGGQSVVSNNYWEAWHVAVDAAGAATITPVRDGLHDVFVIGKDEYRIYRRGGTITVVPTKDHTKGTWKLRGKVYWVREASFDDTHWWRAKNPTTGALISPRHAQAVMEAGRLLSRYDPPVVGDGLAVGGRLGDVLLTRAFAGEWNFVRGETNFARSRPFPEMYTDGFRSEFVIAP